MRDKRCHEVIIVYNSNDLEVLKKYLDKYNDLRIKLVAGGKERQNSVLNGLNEVTSEYVLVHDGARANINQGLIDKLLVALDKNQVVSLGINVTDTIKSVTDCVKTVDRTNLYYVQTPQASIKRVLIECLEKAEHDNVIVTDDLMAIEMYSDIVPTIVAGEKSNIKVTTLEDLNLLKYYME